MKTTITPHENEGRKYLLVGGLPLNSHSLKLFNEGTRNAMFRYTVGDNYSYLDWPYAKSFLGTIHTEGNALVFSEGFDPEVLVEGRKNSWKDYKPYEGYGHAMRVFTSTESLLSLLESKGYTMLNPYGEKPIRRVPFMGPGHYTENQLEEIKQFQKGLDQWRTSEDKRHKFKVAVIEVNQ